MPKITLTIDQLCEAVESLSAEEFSALNRTLDQRRRNRLKEIVQKARQNAVHVTPDEAERIVREAVTEVRAENAAHGRS